jgi:carboxypeptidase C (cathepsin A)
VVITHGIGPQQPTDDAAVLALKNDSEKIWTQLQDQLAQLSTNSRHIIAYNSGHMIPLEEPDIITGAIKNMIFNQNKCAVKEECSENHAARLGSS